jgi:hypothetical protein
LESHYRPPGQRWRAETEVSIRSRLREPFGSVPEGTMLSGLSKSARFGSPKTASALQFRPGFFANRAPKGSVAVELCTGWPASAHHIRFVSTLSRCEPHPLPEGNV